MWATRSFLYPLWKRQKIFCFLTFSRGIEKTADLFIFTIEILNEKLHFLFGDRETVPNFLRFSGQYMISEIQENLWKICHSLLFFRTLLYGCFCNFSKLQYELIEIYRGCILNYLFCDSKIILYFDLCSITRRKHISWELITETNWRFQDFIVFCFIFFPVFVLCFVLFFVCFVTSY